MFHCTSVPAKLSKVKPSKSTFQMRSKFTIWMSLIFFIDIPYNFFFSMKLRIYKIWFRPNKFIQSPAERKKRKRKKINVFGTNNTKSNFNVILIRLPIENKIIWKGLYFEGKNKLEGKCLCSKWTEFCFESKFFRHGKNNTFALRTYRVVILQNLWHFSKSTFFSSEGIKSPHNLFSGHYKKKIKGLQPPWNIFQK